MAYDLKEKLVIGISSRALFDLEKENEIFESQGVEEYAKYQLEHENELLEKGTAFPLIEALLRLNKIFNDPIVEVIVMSRNTPETGLRVFNSINEYGLEIYRAAFTGGESISPYLRAFEVDLFLSKSEEDVQMAIDIGIAAAIIYNPPQDFDPKQDEIRIAFDADAVIFSEESERIYKEKGLEAFIENERANTNKPLPEGPFGKLLKTISMIKEKEEKGSKYVKIAIVTARNSPAHKRVILTLREWGVKVDEAFFLGGVSKEKILKSFNAHIFFDDQEINIEKSSMHIPAGRVPYKSDSPLTKREKEE